MTRSAPEPSQLRSLLTGGRPDEAVILAQRVLREELPPAQRADVLLLRLAALLNAGRRGEYAAALDAAADAVQACPEPERYGQLYTLAALVANLDGSLDRCVTYLARGSRALASTRRVDRAVACAWHDLAMAYSYVGLHGYALSAIEHARRMAAGTGLPEADFVVPGIRVRLATWHDHHGDTDACVRVLRDVVTELSWHQRAYPTGLDGIRPASLGAYGYAAARLAALGEIPPLPPVPPVAAGTEGVRELLDRGGTGQNGRDIRTLGEVCLAIASGPPATALRLLDAADVRPTVMGSAEAHRLRALSYLAAGEPGAAHAADRRAFRIASAQIERLRELHMEAVEARLDQQEAQRATQRQGSESRTDPLTGAYTRAHLEQQVAALQDGGARAVLAVCQLSGLGAVNEAHGRLSGDLVLQRVSSVLARVIRRGDLVARHGGDRFAVLLPGAAGDEAREVAARIEAAMSAQNWASLVPGTPVSISVEWSDTNAARPAPIDQRTRPTLREVLGQVPT